MSLTTQEKINIGRVCTILASEEVNSGTPVGGALDKNLSVQLFALSEGLEMVYELDNVSPDIEQMGNDLISKCRHYPQALSKMNILSGGGTIVISPTSGSTFFEYFITATDVANNYFTVNSVDLKNKVIVLLFSSGVERPCITSTSTISVLVAEDRYWFNPTTGRFTYFDSPLVEGTRISGIYSNV